MPKGYLAVVLHAHLPYVRHPEHDNFLEETWFYEALSETYIPLLKMFSRLEDDNVGYKALLSLSPTLTSMMADELLQERYVRHVKKVLRLADAQLGKNAPGGPPRELADFYCNYFRDILYWFEEKCGRDLVAAFRNLASYGNLDLMTCGATHGFLPILQHNPAAVRAQILTARDHHESLFGERPTGIWLPECAYYAGVEKHLADAGFSYTFVDSHGIENADSKPKYGLYAPVVSEEGVAFFGRDRETGYQVWSAEQGYPGHSDYREFYRDLGYQLDEEELGDFLVDNHIRVNTGLKFNRITSRQAGDKDWYNPASAREQAARHAQHFVNNRVGQIERLAGTMDRPPLVVAPYDAELFGHWWFEGPRFLDYVLRKSFYDQQVFETLTPKGYLKLFPENQHALPAGSSWGGDGTYEFWVNDTNQDVIPRLHQASDRLSEIVRGRKEFGAYAQGGHSDQIVRQMMRELLLAQASDWPFIMRTGTSPGYATKRIDDHLNRFWRLDAMLSAPESAEDEKILAAIAAADNIFPNCDPGLYLH